MFEILFLFLFLKQSLLEIPMVKNMGRAVGAHTYSPSTGEEAGVLQREFQDSQVHRETSSQKQIQQYF